MLDSAISGLSLIAVVTGGLACVVSLYLAATQPAQRKGHLARAVLFGGIAVVMSVL